MRIKPFTALLLVLASFLALAGCGSDAPQDYATPERHFTSEAAQDAAVKQFSVYDPAQALNKRIYTFNAELDNYFFLPVVNGYVAITPEFLRKRITNFFLNIGEVNNFTNAFLQAKLVKASQTAGRFAVNTTIGIVGTFDVATDWGLTRQPEDFGKTLGYWGVGAGAYVVLPVLGPSNVRDTIGKVVDYATLYFVIPESVKDNAAYDVVSYGLEPINARYNNGFRYYSTGSPFEYELVRFIVSKARAVEVANERK